MKQPKQPPVRKNDDLTLEIEALTGEGQGIARVQGYAVFVPGALPGECIRAHVIKVTPGYAVAKPLETLSTAPERVRPACSAYPACGGCTLQHLDYSSQLALKRRIVVDALERLGGFSAPDVAPVRGMDDPWRYRNKGSFPFGSADGRPAFGFYAPRSHRLVPLEDCPIQDARIVDIARRVQEWAACYGVAPYEETTRAGVLRHVMARVTDTGESMAVIVAAAKRLPHADALLPYLPDVDSVYLNVNRADTNVIFGPEFRLLRGKPALEERIGGLRFAVSPQSFLQVNARQVAVLYGEAVRLLGATPREHIVDAYCGVGTISLLLAAHAAHVTGIEVVPEAVENARQNAAANGVANASFLCGQVEDVLVRLDRPVDAIVLDPPRKGCDPRALDAIAESGAGRVVYVSCNPATLARDCARLAAHGFRLACATPVDMFPHTGHIETVVLMTKSENRGEQHVGFSGE
jgi:23S rRNA (uracil1939-C5)-methyltransferase